MILMCLRGIVYLPAPSEPIVWTFQPKTWKDI